MTMPAPIQRRALTTGDFLIHDMTPRDPYEKPPRAQSMYEPSSGPSPRYRGFTSNQMLADHQRPAGFEDPGAAYNNQSHRKPQASDPFGKRNDPGKAQGVDEFYAGKYTTPYQKTPGQGINNIFSPEAPVEHAQKIQTHQKEIENYMRQVKQSKDDVAKQRDVEKRQDLDSLTRYDPWGKPGAGAPGGSKKIVSLESQNKQVEANVTDAYAAQVFGKSGAGAPIRTNSGKVKTHLTLDGETQLNNVYRDNLGAHAVERYGEKSPGQSYRDALEQQKMEREQTKAADRSKELELDKQHVEQNPFYSGKKNNNGKIFKKEVEREEQVRKANYAQALQAQAKQKQSDKDREKTDLNSSQSYEPWGQGVGKPERDASGKLIKRAATTVPSDEGSFAGLLGKPGGGAPAKEGTGKISPKKPDVKEGEVYDPFGKPGAGAPSSVTRVTTHPELGGSFKAKENADQKRKLFQEQQQQLEMKKQYTEMESAREKQSSYNPDEFFKWGSGAANPKRDESGAIASQKRGQTDVIGMNLDTGGGLGRKQLTTQSRDLHKELDRQTQDRINREATVRANEVDQERMHAQNADLWQGKGVGAPRRNDRGEIHGRFALDNEVHHEEIADTAKVIPKSDRKKYGEELNQLQQIKQEIISQEISKDREQTSSHLQQYSTQWGKQGHGAPLRSDSGKVVTVPSRVRDKEDVEWKLNAKQAYKME